MTPLGILPPPTPVVIIIGIGHPDRGDDGAGLRVAEQLAAAGLPAVVHAGDGTSLLELWDGADTAILIDATAIGAAPGTIVRLDATRERLDDCRIEASSHGLGAGFAVEMARALGRLPPTVTLFGIEGGCFEVGAPLSPAVAAACETVAALIRGDVAAYERAQLLEGAAQA